MRRLQKVLHKMAECLESRQNGLFALWNVVDVSDGEVKVLYPEKLFTLFTQGSIKLGTL